MNSELKSRLVDWAWLTFAVTSVTYAVTLPWVWFSCEFWVGMGYRESLPPAPEIVQAQVWREFLRAELWLPLAFWPWFAFAYSVIGIGIALDIRHTRKTHS